MDAESKELLKKTFALAEENNKILRKMRRSQKIASFLRFVYWVIILGVTFGAFYLLQPYVDKITGLYNTVFNTSQKLNNTVNSVNSINSSGVQDLLKQFQNEVKK